VSFLLQANEKSKKATNVLMTVLSGDTAVQAQTMTDKEVVDSCMNTLRKLFPYEVKHSSVVKLFWLFVKKG